MRYNHGIIINDFSSPVLSICWMNPRGQAFNFIFLYDYFTSPAENQCQLRYWIDANSVALFDYGIWHLLFNDRLRPWLYLNQQLQTHARRSTTYRELRDLNWCFAGSSATIDQRVSFFFFLVFQSSFCRHNFSPFFIWFFYWGNWVLEQKIRQQSKVRDTAAPWLLTLFGPFNLIRKNARNG